MKKLLTVALALVLVTPAVAFAGSSTDAALALGAFAVFNQIISGAGLFGGIVGQPAMAAPVVYAPPPVVVAPPPVVVAPPPHVVVAPPPRVVVAPAPVVVVRPGPVHGGYAYYVGPKHGHHGGHKHAYRKLPKHALRGWCPPGHGKHGRC